MNKNKNSGTSLPVFSKKDMGYLEMISKTISSIFSKLSHEKKSNKMSLVYSSLAESSLGYIASGQSLGNQIRYLEQALQSRLGVFSCRLFVRVGKHEVVHSDVEDGEEVFCLKELTGILGVTVKKVQTQIVFNCLNHPDFNRKLGFSSIILIF